MSTMRMMDRPEDFERLGIDPSRVAPWEDGVRNDDGVGNNEVWYFDANFDDGSKVVVGFRPKTAGGMREVGYQPNLNLDITRPDGRTTQEFAFASWEDSSMSAEQCDVHFGPNFCRGDFAEYDVHVESTASIACDLHYRALTEPFRQGTGIIGLGDADEFFYTDLCVPKCEVTGTLVYDGETHEVHGFGYHDHQWMNISPFAAFHHWLWGRMYTEDYTVYIYDFVGSERFGFTRVPFFIVADNATGRIVFTTNGDARVSTTLEPTSVGKDYPRTSQYLFHDDSGNEAEFDVSWDEILERRDTYGDSPKDAAEAAEIARAKGLTDMQKVVGGTKEQFDAMRLQPTYIRFFAHGGVRLVLDGVESRSEGSMIYEYNYPGVPDPRAGM